MKNKIIYIISFTAGIVLFLFFILKGNYKDYYSIINPDYIYLTGFFLSFTLSRFFYAVRWKYLSQHLLKTKSHTVMDYFYYSVVVGITRYFSSNVVSEFIGKPLMLKGIKKFTLTESIKTVLIDKFFDFFLAVLLGIPALFGILGLISINYYFITCIGIALLLFLLLQVFQKNNRIHFKLPFNILNKVPVIRNKFKKLEDKHFSFSIKVFLFACLFSLIGLFFLFTRLFFLVKSFSLNDIPVLPLLYGIPCTQLLLIIAFTPGALGILEGGWYSILQSYAVRSNVISVFLLILRMYQLFFDIILLVICTLFLLIKNYISRE